MRPFIKYAFHLLLNARGSVVILQNPDDVELMCKENVLRRDRIVLIRGSGVDIHKFMFRSAPQGEPLVLLASRLLWDKGIGEFVSAARSLRRQGTGARFVLVGERDTESPSAIPIKQLRAWQEEG